MSLVSKSQRLDGPEAVAEHTDFQLPWVKSLLADPNLQWTVQVPRQHLGGTVINAMFERTLAIPEGIRAHLSFNRPCAEEDAVTRIEECWLLSVGHDIAGAAGRTHVSRRAKGSYHT